MNQQSGRSVKKSIKTNNENHKDFRCTDNFLTDDEMDRVDDFDETDGMDGLNADCEADCYDNKNKPYWLLRGELASWACTSGKSNTASSLSDLLKILGPYGFKNLPNDSRALMNTPRESNSLIRDVFPGQYIHIGLQKGIEFEFERNCVDVSRIKEVVVVIDCDMDGVRVCKSSNITFWPIWCRIQKPFMGEPFLVGLYVGKGAPKDANSYIYDFVAELDHLKKEGFKVEGDTIVFVHFGRFIGDSPGRCDIFGKRYYQ